MHLVLRGFCGVFFVWLFFSLKRTVVLGKKNQKNHQITEAYLKHILFLQEPNEWPTFFQIVLCLLNTLPAGRISPSVEQKPMFLEMQIFVTANTEVSNKLSLLE